METSHMLPIAQRPPRLRLPRLADVRFHASRVSSRSVSAGNFPALSSSIPAAYSVSPDRSVCGRRALSRHFCTAEGLIPKRLPTFVSPIWSIALATVLAMAASLHRKCKFTIDRECKRRAPHSRHGTTTERDVLGPAGTSQSGCRFAVRIVGHRARTRSMALGREEVARWAGHARREEPHRIGRQSRRQYGVAENGAR